MATVSVYSVRSLDKRILPTVIDIASDNAKNRINKIINDSVKSVSENLSLTSSDFYTKTADENGNTLSLSVNTMLTNDVCSSISEALTYRIAEMDSGDISVPIGALTGISSFANIGPKYPVKIMPSAQTEVDYESSFTAQGINQINFQVWLNIRVAVKIVNPNQPEYIIVTRKIALVNTLIPGAVPDSFFNIGK